MNKFFLHLSLILSCLFIAIESGVKASYRDELPSLENLGSEAWIQTKLQKYPELQWLLDADVCYTQEGKAEQFEHSWSMKITGFHYPEFERTILSMVNLYLIADGSEAAYKRFTQLQPASEKLSRDSFKNLHLFADEILKAHFDNLQALEINLLLGDLGKTPQAHALAKPFGITEPDHDIFLDECLQQCPEIFQTFISLNQDIQKQLKKVAGLLHFGHLSHVEGGPAILSKLKQSRILNNNPSGFDFEILTNICDVAAARGHEDNRGSKSFTENTWYVFEAIKKTLHTLATSTETEALASYLTYRAEGLGLNFHHHEELIVARLGTMMRLFSKNDGKALQAGYALLSTEDKELLLKDFDPLLMRNERTQTYVPTIFINLLATYAKQGLSREVAIQKSVSEGVVCVVKFLHAYRNGQASQPYSQDLTLNFNKVAGQVRDNPGLLRDAQFLIDRDGMVLLN